MPSKSWSTNTVGASEQFAYWHDAVSQAVLNVAPRNTADERFSGDTLRQLHGVRATFTARVGAPVGFLQSGQVPKILN